MATKWIEDKLQARSVFTPNDIEEILVQFTGVRDAKRETNVLDFKEKLDLNTEGKCGLAKAVCEFSNSSGGVLVFGVQDSGERVGVPGDTVDRLDPADVQQALEKYCAASEISLNVIPCDAFGLKFAALIIYPNNKPIVMHADGEYEIATKKKWDFRRGQILVRYGAKGDVAHQKDVDKILDRMAVEQSKRLLKRFETVAMLPATVELAAIDPITGRAARLIGDDQGVPVKLVEEAQAPALAVTEIFTSDPFTTLEQSVMAQVRTYKMENQHRVNAKVVAKWFLNRVELPRIEAAAELGFLSCLKDRGFPCFWAALLPRDTLRSLIGRCTSQPEYPDLNVLPYVIGAFYWEERIGLLQPIIGQRTYPSAARVAHKVKNMEWREFFLHSRVGSRHTINTPSGALISSDYLASDAEKCVTLFEEFLNQFVSGDLRDKNTAAQLDIIAFGDRIPGGLDS